MGFPSHRAIRKFQSTLPMRGATSFDCKLYACKPISIHTPHAGSDPRVLSAYIRTLPFQSTLPMRGATRVLLPW